MSINDATVAVTEELAARDDMIICDGVDKWYGDFQALKGVSATIKEREVVVVLGKRDQLLLLAPDEENEGALRLERQQSARGTLVALKVARGGHRRSSPRDVREDDDRDSPPSDGVDLLVALSDSGELSLLRYDTETRRFARFRSARLGPPGMRRVAPGVASRAAPLAARRRSYLVFFFLGGRRPPRAAANGR